MSEKNINIYVNPNWTYKQAVRNLKTLKDSYESQLASFSVFETRKKAEYRYLTRKQFYQLKLLDWQIENLWNCMNNNFPYSHLIRSAKRFK
jgi:uncharacterized protein YxjI